MITAVQQMQHPEGARLVDAFEVASMCAYRAFTGVNNALGPRLQQRSTDEHKPVNHDAKPQWQCAVGSTADKWLTAPTLVTCSNSRSVSTSKTSTATATDSAVPQHMLKYELQAASMTHCMSTAATLDAAVFHLAEGLFSRVRAGAPRAYWQCQRGREHVTSVDVYCNPETAAQYEVYTALYQLFTT
jgi:hypothetical protein